MMDFSTDDWSFCFEEEPDIKIASDEAILPYITEAEAWKQYNNPIIYEADKLTREWLAALCKDKKWCRTQKMRKYSFRQIFEQLHGRPYNGKSDAKLTNAYAKVFSYYSSRVHKHGTDHTGKQSSNALYVISPRRLSSPPYSLKLRLEWMAEQGIVPTHRNMKLPVDMPQGTARNPRTAANMERRSRLAKDRYNERYADRAR